MGWLPALELALALLLVLVVLPVAGLFARRRWLSADDAAVFDCALHLRETTKGVGWSTGVARYRGDELQWFRTFSLSLRPRLVLQRDQTTAMGHRPPNQAEAVMMFSDDEILRLETRTDAGARIWELAMNPQSLTGLMSWLEAAPPGGDGYSGLGERAVEQ